MNKDKIAKYLTNIICEAFDFDEVANSVDLSDGISAEEINQLILKDISVSIKKHYGVDLLPENLLPEIPEVFRVQCSNEEYFILPIEITPYVPRLPWNCSTIVIDPIQNWDGQDNYTEFKKDLLLVVTNIEKAAFRNNPRYRYDKLSPYSDERHTIYMLDKRTNEFHYTAYFMNDKNYFMLDETNVMVLKEHWSADGYVQCLVVNTKIINTNY